MKFRQTTCASREERYHATDGVLQPVREHSRAQALAPAGEQPQEPALNHDDNHSLMIVPMCEAKHDALKDHSEHKTARPRIELSGEIAAKDEFLTETGRRGHCQPYHKLECCLGRDIRESAVRVASKKMQKQEHQATYQRDSDNKKSDSYS